MPRATTAGVRVSFSGRDIVCLASQSWSSHWCTPQQIMSRLAAEHRVLYVEPLRSPLWRLKKHATQSSGGSGAPIEVARNLWVYNPPPVFMPLQLYHRSPMLAAVNGRISSRYITQAAARIGFTDPVYWVFQVTHCGSPLLRSGAPVVYDCIDEWAGVVEGEGIKRYITAIDRELCREADVLFVGSSSLARAREGLNPATALVPQGVDLSHFLRASLADVEPPSDVAEVKRPIIGLIGVLNKERLDVDLLCHLADRRPQWSLVLVGPVWEGLRTEPLRQRPNIHLLGNKPLPQLGDYLASFDVCILPYLINDFTRNIFPLKLFEYLASGKPFVSTPIPACGEFPRLIRTESTPEKFLEAVEESLTEKNSALREERIALARLNDWDRRAEDKARFVAEVLSRPSISAPIGPLIRRAHVDA